MGGVVAKWHGEVLSKILLPIRDTQLPSQPSRHSGTWLAVKPMLLVSADFKVPRDDTSVLLKPSGSHLPRLLFHQWSPTKTLFSGRKTPRNKDLCHFHWKIFLKYTELVLNSLSH